MLEAVSIIGLLVVMGLALFLIIIPPVPVGALEWALAMVFAVLNGFSRITPTAAVIITILMILSVTSDFWLPLFGLQGQQISCLGLVGFFVGMIIGSMLIPVFGTFIGAVVGVMLVEFAQMREWQKAVESGGAALKLIIAAMVVEFLFAVAIVGVVLISIITTIP